MKKNSKYKLSELEDAMANFRPAFLGKRINIDDVSNDIRLLENDLNSMEVNDYFLFQFETVRSYKYSKQVEAYEFLGPVISRALEWKKHGNRWRLFYSSTFLGCDLFTGVPGNECDEREELALSQLIESKMATEGKGIVLVSKPVIDETFTVRMNVHPRLPDFTKAFANDWVSQKYTFQNPETQALLSRTPEN